LSKTALFYENIKAGTAIGYIELARKLKYSIMLMNPNKLFDNKQGARVGEFYDHYSHCEYIWKEYITKSDYINNIIIIAEKNASLTAIKLMNKFGNDFKYKVTHLYLINSGHGKYYELLDQEKIYIFEKVIRRFKP
jgi:hypothetical protein